MTLDTRPVLHGAGEMVGLVRDFAWDGTGLGSPSGWSPVLRALVDAALAAAYPVVLAWGPGATMVYNDAFRPLLGTRHPAALGSDARALWSAPGGALAPGLADALAGRAVQVDDVVLPVDRGRADPEAHAAVSFLPIREADGGVAGCLCSFTETTGRVLSERRLAFRLDVNEWRGERKVQFLVEGAEI